MGLQPLQAEGEVEVRPLPAELLLLAAVSERFLAHRTQAPLLQADQVHLVRALVRPLGVNGVFILLGLSAYNALAKLNVSPLLFLVM